MVESALLLGVPTPEGGISTNPAFVEVIKFHRFHLRGLAAAAHPEEVSYFLCKVLKRLSLVVWLSRHIKLSTTEDRRLAVRVGLSAASVAEDALRYLFIHSILNPESDEFKSFVDSQLRVPSWPTANKKPGWGEPLRALVWDQRCDMIEGPSRS